MPELDLNTLKHVKHIFELHGDCSTECLGYMYICKQINRLEVPYYKIIEFDEEYAETLIEVLNEHRT